MARESAPNVLDVVLSPAWLTDALGPDGNAGKATDVTVVEQLQTVATKVRFEVVFEDDNGGRSSRNYCVKGYFSGDASSSGAGHPEALFYDEMAATLGINVPRCPYVGIDASTGHAMIIMDDLVAKGSRFLTALTAYSPDEARASLAELARLHADTWDRAGLAEQAWLEHRIGGMPDRFPLDLLQRLLDDGRGPDLPPALHDAATVSDGLRQVIAGDAGRAHCLVHGDAHAGNIYVDADGRPGIIDWQVVHFGHWATDVAYHIGAVLSIEDRRAHEAELLRGYLAELERLGPPAPAWDEAWDDYRAHLPYGYYLWAITQRVDRPIMLEFVDRLGTAVADHDTFDLIGAG